MMDVGRHPNVELLALSELVGLRGEPGDFVATVRRYPRYVDEDECVGCGDCEAVCPMVAPNVYEHGMGARKAIFRPFPQAVPSAYMIDRDVCLNEDVFLACSNCATACPREAIDFDQRVQDVELEVGAVIVATGFDEFDPRVMRNYGYGIYENVMTSLEFERMLSASGPTKGHVVRPTDLEPPKRIVYVQCVGAGARGASTSARASAA